MRFPDSPFAMPGDGGFWMVSHQIGQYPDYQLRVIKRQLGMQWVNSPHHVMFGLNEGLFSNFNIQADLIHYHGKEDSRQRESIERQWVRHQATRNRLGLEADVFECDVKPELAKYAKPEYWEEL
jgi:hypothetical protein